MPINLRARTESFADPQMHRCGYVEAQVIAPQLTTTTHLCRYMSCICFALGRNPIRCLFQQPSGDCPAVHAPNRGHHEDRPSTAKGAADSVQLKVLKIVYWENTEVVVKVLNNFRDTVTVTVWQCDFVTNGFIVQRVTEDLPDHIKTATDKMFDDYGISVPALR